VRNLAFKQQLRVCNAYPDTAALDIYLGKAKLSSKPLAYKACDEFSPKLHVDDELDFKVGDSSVGTFTISDLPSNDAVLLMVIFRHDAVSTAVSFESHVFSRSASSAQVAVLDTYRGSLKSEIRIQDLGAETGTPAPVPSALAPEPGPRSELLRVGGVVAVDPGAYEVLLKAPGTGEASNSTTQATADFVAKVSESYVVVRCGVEAKTGATYPPELMIYPPADMGAAAPGAQPFTALLLVASLWAAAVAKP